MSDPTIAPCPRTPPTRPAVRTSRGGGGTSSGLPGSQAELPESLKPQLATLVDGVPRHGDDWLYEVKFDGYRMMARVEGARVQMFTRNGHDWGDKLPHLVASIQRLNVGSAWIDGEIVVLADNGVPSFQALQNAFDGKRTANIIFYAFDLPILPGGTFEGSRFAYAVRCYHSWSLQARMTSSALARPSRPLPQTWSRPHAVWVWRESWPSASRAVYIEPH